MKARKYRVIADVQPKPRPAEYSAAEILTDFFKANIEFIQEGRTRTPDLLINGQEWEIKRPTGVKESSVLHQFQRASKQAKNMIFDGRASRLHQNKLKHLVQDCFDNSKIIKRLVMIDSRDRVIELKKSRKKRR